jgi:hypothetical protein
MYGGTRGQGSASVPREDGFGNQGILAETSPGVVRRGERAEDDGATYSELRSDP